MPRDPLLGWGVCFCGSGAHVPPTGGFYLLGLSTPTPPGFRDLLFGVRPPSPPRLSLGSRVGLISLLSQLNRSSRRAWEFSFPKGPDLAGFHPYFRAVTAGVDPSSGTSGQADPGRVSRPGRARPPLPWAAPQPKFCPVCADSAPACGNGLLPHLPVLSPLPARPRSSCRSRLSGGAVPSCVTAVSPLSRSSMWPPLVLLLLLPAVLPAQCCGECGPGAPDLPGTPPGRGLALSSGGPRGAGLGVMSPISSP